MCSITAATSFAKVLESTSYEYVAIRQRLHNKATDPLGFLARDLGSPQE
jgi:hypothetical protein